jgi:hypothetical protein
MVVEKLGGYAAAIRSGKRRRSRSNSCSGRNGGAIALIKRQSRLLRRPPSRLGFGCGNPTARRFSHVHPSSPPMTTMQCPKRSKAEFGRRAGRLAIRPGPCASSSGGLLANPLTGEKPIRWNRIFEARDAEGLTRLSENYPEGRYISEVIFPHITHSRMTEPVFFVREFGEPTVPVRYRGGKKNKIGIVGRRWPAVSEKTGNRVST